MSEEKATYTTEIAPLKTIDISKYNIKAKREKLLAIPAMPETKEQYETAREIHISLKPAIRIIDDRRKDINRENTKKTNDDAATATEIFQGVIDMAQDRRLAWEAVEDKKKAEKEEKKAAEQVKEQERLDFILAGLEKIKELFSLCLEYGIDSGIVKVRIQALEDHHVSEESYQEYFEEAKTIKKSGLASAELALDGRVKFEKEQEELKAKQKAQAEAQAKFEAENKAEADRLAKIKEAQDKKDLEAKKIREAEVKKLADEKAAFEAERKEQERFATEKRELAEKELAEKEAAFEAKQAAIAEAEEERLLAEKKRKEDEAREKAEKEAAELLAARLIEQDLAWAEALPFHIWEHVYPVAILINSGFDRDKRAEMDAESQRNMLILKDRNVIEVMARSIIEAIDAGFPKLKVDELESLVDKFGNDIEELIHDLKSDVANVE